MSRGNSCGHAGKMWDSMQENYIRYQNNAVGKTPFMSGVKQWHMGFVITFALIPIPSKFRAIKGA